MKRLTKSNLLLALGLAAALALGMVACSDDTEPDQDSKVVDLDGGIEAGDTLEPDAAHPFPLPIGPRLRDALGQGAAVEGRGGEKDPARARCAEPEGDGEES